MVFSSLLFIFGYLSFTLAGYYLLPRRWRNAFLFVVNLAFYAFGEPVFIVVMLVSIVINYYGGRLMGRYPLGSRPRRAVLWANVALDLLLLAFFKYTGFFAGILREIPAFSSLQIPKIPLPIGISFYTFQTMSYIIDVYRGNSEPQRSFTAFGNYVALFPQLIAGPIVRYHDVAEQLSSRRESAEKLDSGIRLFAVGLAKKVLIANEMGAMYEALAAPGSGAVGAWAAALAFSFQIYFDFSGYSDMAIGLGRLFGFDFLKNFDYPYTSRSVTEFWRRWHISLGTWFREYVYIPLGGNRVRPARHIFNIMLVWLLTGFWHGASWNFLLWGLYYGLLLLCEKYLLAGLLRRAPAIVSRIYTLAAVLFGWVLFAFEDFTALGAFTARMFGAEGFIGGSAPSLILAYLPLLLVAALASTPLAKNLYGRFSARYSTRWADAVLIALTLILCTASLVRSSYNPFLYFRF